MAVLFTLPNHLWHVFSSPTGVNIKKMIKMIKDDRDDSKKIDQIIKLIQVQLDMTKYLYKRRFIRRRFHRSNCCGRLTLLLFTTKLLYLANTAGQLLFLISFLSLRRIDLDVRAFDRVFRDGVDGFESSRFPRVAMCDFMIRELGSNQHWYSVQCNLPINIFNEVIFVSMTFWLIILTIMNSISIIFWIHLLININRKRSIVRCLRFYESLETNITLESSKQMENSFTDYIGLDGFIMLRILGYNTDQLFMIQTIGHLYKHYVANINKTDRSTV